MSLKQVPKHFESINVDQIDQLVAPGDIFKIDGLSDQFICLSFLLHGNETTGFLVVQQLLKKYLKKKPKKGIVFVVGNSIAAARGVRHLEGQADFNRIWSDYEGPESAMVKRVLKTLASMKLFANIDIHNNTGRNPFYSCINSMEPSSYQLASMFSDKAIYFTSPSKVQANALLNYCPSITIEAGLPGESIGVEKVLSFIEDLLELDSFVEDFSASKLSIYHTIGRLCVDPRVNVSFEHNSKGLELYKDLEDYNFTIIKKGDFLGRSTFKKALSVIDNDENDITPHFLKSEDGKITAAQHFIPSMLTKDKIIMKTDCLGYLMEEILPL